MLRTYLDHALTEIGVKDAAGQPMRYTFHDFRRLFITDAIVHGMPPHIAQLVAGHRDINTTMGYKAVYPEEVINGHRAFIARRRALRPCEEYRTPTDAEWAEFVGHFQRRKVAIGDCGRSYDTACIHEHSCLRCPLLRPDPAARARLEEIRDNLLARIAEAESHRWYGEAEGLKVSLAGANAKLAQMDQISASRTKTVQLGIPSFTDTAGRTTEPCRRAKQVLTQQNTNSTFKINLVRRRPGRRGLVGQGRRAGHVPALARAAGRIRRLRDLTRYRRDLVQDRTREKQRVEKLLEDARIKISSVLSDLHGVSGRAMMDALDRRRARSARAGPAGQGPGAQEDRPARRGVARDSSPTTTRRSCSMMLDNSDRISAQIAALDTRIEEAIGPFSGQAARLADIPGVDTVAAAELIAEIGVDMTRFPSAAHLVSWAKFCPQTHQSAGKSSSKGRGKGNPWLAGTLGRIAFANLVPTPSWAPDTGAWPDAAASRRPSSPPAIRC